MTRNEVINAVASAITWEECQDADHMLRQWMNAYPDDIMMRDAGEVLAMTMEGLEPDEVLEEPGVFTNH